MRMMAVVRKRNKPTRVMANFIGVLEKMREVLRPRLPTELCKHSLAHPADGAPVSKESVNDHIVNLFESPEIEQPSDVFLNSESPPGQHPISTPQVRYGVDQAQDLEEVCFAVPCLSNDFNKICRLLFIVGYISMTAVETSKLAGLLAPKDVITSRLLVKAAGVVRRYWRNVRKKLGLIC
jgi:hypothetical protein